MPKLEIAIVGGGIAGLSVAHRLVKNGHKITIFDPHAGFGASHAAAGMLAPASEINFQEVELLKLMRHSNDLWPSFASDIESHSNTSVDLRKEGTIILGFEQNDAREMERIAEFQKELGITVERLTRSMLRGLEPDVVSPVAYAALIPSDHQVDNRLLMTALQISLRSQDVLFIEKIATELIEKDPESYALVFDDGSIIEPEVLILAPGAYLSMIKGVPEPYDQVIRPVKGQIIRVLTDPNKFNLRHVLRAKIANKGIYMVPRVNGEIVIGATQEEVGFDETARVRPIADLLTQATIIAPAIGEADFKEQLVRFRPGTPDNGPIVGRHERSNLFFSVGHFRHGILLSAAISKYLAIAVETGFQPLEIAPFDPARFKNN